MAIYHFSVKTISRGSGRSAIAAAAYRSGEKLVCDYYGKEQDYTKKTGVEFTNIYAPENTNFNLLDRQNLWNAVEKSERRKDALLAREFEIAFPQELNQEQRKALLDDLCKSMVQKHGVIVDAAIHAPHTGSGSDERNYHAHIMFTTRAINSKGSFEAKKYRDFSRDNGTGVVTQWRKDFADLVNTQLEQIGSTERVSHLSYEDQDNGLEATLHEGYKVTQQRRRYEAEQQKDEKKRDPDILMPEVAQANDAIKERNAEKIENEQLITGLDQEIIVSDAILSDLQHSKTKADAELVQQQKIAAERKREHLLAQAILDAQNRTANFHENFNPDTPNKRMVMQYLDDYALLVKQGKEPQRPAPVEQPQPTWWQKLMGKELAPVEQPPFFEISEVKAVAKRIAQQEERRAREEKEQRLEKFLQKHSSEVDQLEKQMFKRAYSQNSEPDDVELKDFINLHREQQLEKEHAKQQFKADYERHMRDQAEKANAEAELIRKREREYEAQLAAHRERSERLDRENAEIQRNSRSISTEDTLKPSPKNDFKP